MDKGLIISKAIKEGKWLDISYQHSDSEVTYFWIAILKVYENKNLEVKMFNDKKGFECMFDTDDI